MSVVRMCAWVSTFFCCCCRGNFEYCSLTVKRVIHPLVDLPSALALKTNNLSLDWVYSCLDSGRKTGRLKKNPASCCSCINFFFALSAQVLRAMCPLWQSSGSDIVTPTHMKNRRKRREKMKKEDECVSFKRTKGGKREKKTYWWCEFRINELAKFSGHNNADIQANFQLHTDLSFNTFIEKKNFKIDQQCSDFKEKSRGNLVSVVYVTKAKKKIQSQRTMTWSLCVHVDNFFLYVCVVLTHTTEHTES